jgi:chemosensory pili system protein ChpA (sensor histidine kinase/response regulator)
MQPETSPGTSRARRQMRHDAPAWSHQTVQWVNRELASTIANARNLLERFAEDPADLELMRRFGNLMHTAFGALRMVDIQGATLLVEEIEAVAAEMEHQRLASAEDGLDALTRAIVQLPAYVERVIGGEGDLPLLLLPLLNDLRAVRGSPLLSESTLFIFNVPAESMPAEFGGKADAGDIDKVLARLHPHFQAALLGWLKGREDSPRCLARMGVVAENVIDLTRVSSLAQLFWVVCSVVEALQESGLPASASVKRLMGQAERQLRRVVTHGEGAFEAEPAAELLSNLLYYVARASSNGERVTAVKQAFALRELLPESDELDSARADLGAPSAELMDTVAGAIKQDLARVKEALDAFVREQPDDFSSLGNMLEEFKRIADTLRVLGLGDLALRVQGQRDALAALIEGVTAGSADSLLETAAALLEVEDQLDEALAAQSLSAGGEKNQSVEGQEFQKVVASVMRECISTLGEVTEVLGAIARDPAAPADGDHLVALMKSVAASLQILERDAAARVATRIARVLGESLQGGAEPPAESELDRLADALVGLEYYMETVGSGRPDPMSMLDNATTCLDLLDPGGTVGTEESPMPPELMPDDALAESASAPTPEPSGSPERPEASESLETSKPQKPSQAPEVAGQSSTADDSAARQGPEASAVSAPAAAAPGLAVRGDDGEPFDPDLLELFLEEAGEQLEAVGDCLDAWMQESDSEESLTILRRAFHTLKGSGRMIGATVIGEVAWRVEHLCNGLANGRLEPSDEVRRYVVDVASAFPELLTGLQGGECATDVVALLRRGSALGNLPMEDVDSIAATLATPSDAVEPDAAASTPAPVADAQAPLEPPSQSSLDTDSASDDVPADAADSVGTGDAETSPEAVATMVMPPEPDATMVMPPEPDATMVMPPEPDATMVMPPEPDATMVMPPEPDATMVMPPEPDATMVMPPEPDATMVMPPEPDATMVMPGEQDSPGTVDAPGGDVAAAAEAGGEDPLARHETDAFADDMHATGTFEFDDTLVDIFAEEAGELLERADDALSSWRSGDGEASLDELKRVLHTLKGGARMAGISPVGDISHELESLLLRLGDDDRVSRADMLELVQATIDRLHAMRDELLARRPLSAVARALADIRRLSGAGAPGGGWRRDHDGR